MGKKENIFKRMAKERGITEAEMRLIIQNRILAGLQNQPPNIRKQWEAIPCAGDVPTPEEYIRYVVEKLQAEGKIHLLRKYIR